MTLPRGARFSVARITLEFLSPVHIGTGRGDEIADAVFAANADGLPVLPGASIAGVLRHAWAEAHGEDSRDEHKVTATNHAFGYQLRSKGDDRAGGAAANIEVSFGHPHNANDRPVPFWGGKNDGDPVLAALREGIDRDHVRIDAHGVADGRGKFDRRVVPAGARFTFELFVHEGAGPTVAQLLGLLAGVRLGAHTRSGLGKFKVVQALARDFDLTKAKDFDDFSRLDPDLHEPLPAGLLGRCDPEPPKDGPRVTATIRIEPESWWMFGGGTPTRQDHRRKGKGKGDEARRLDRVNVHEPQITWANGRGTVTTGEHEPDVAPASGLKGALRHRVAFHARRKAGEWARSDRLLGEPGEPPRLPPPDEEPTVQRLFGAIAKSKDAGTQKGRTGRLVLDDGVITGDKAGVLDHVSLDRFTQGTVAGLLFDEGPRFGGTLEFQLTVDTRDRRDPVTPDDRFALRAALEDLVTGRLAFGAASSRGLGVARSGTVTWSDGGKWIAGGAR